MALALGLLVLSVGAAVLAGWIFDVGALRDVLALGPAMRANVAVGFILSSCALVALVHGAARMRLAAGVTGAAVALLGLLTLSQDLGGWNLGIDEWLVRDRTGTARFTIPGRMSPPTALCFSLFGAGLVALSWRGAQGLRQPLVLGTMMTVVLIACVALLGHAVVGMTSVDFLNFSRISSNAAICLVLLGCGGLALLRAEGRIGWAVDGFTMAGFGIGLAVMVFVGAISYQFTSHLRADNAEVNRVTEVLKEIQRLTALFADFTITTGRYIITRDESALAPRPALRTGIDAGIARLRKIAIAPGQQDRLDRIAQLHARRIVMSEEIIAAFRARLQAGTPSAPGEPSPLGTLYPSLGIEIERLLREMEATAHGTLESRQKAAAQTARTTFLLLPLGIFLSMAILVIGLFFLNASAVERRRARAELEVQRRRLASLHEIDRAIIAAETPAQIAEAALTRLRDLLAAPRASLGLIDVAKAQLRWLVVVGPHVEGIAAGSGYALGPLGVLEGLRRGETQMVEVGPAFDESQRAALHAAGVHRFAMVPMRVRGELIGSLNFGGTAPEFPREHLEVASEVAAQLAIAISHTRLGDSARRADAQYRLLFESVPVSITLSTQEGTFLSVNPGFARIFGYDSPEAAMTTLNARAVAVYADPESRNEYLRRVRRDGVVENFEARFRRSDGSLIWGSLSARTVENPEGGAPLLVTMIVDTTERKLQEQRIARLNRVKDMQSSVNAAVIRLQERQALLDALCRVAVEQGGFRAAWIAWHDETARVLAPVASAGHLEGFLDLVRVSTDGSADQRQAFSLRVLRSGAAICANDLRNAPDVTLRMQAIRRGYMATMHLPLTAGGRTEGVLVLCAAEAEVFDAEERQLLEELAADVSFALDSLEKSKRLDYLAYYDPLTGLPNRALFHDRLSHSLRPRQGDPTVIAVALLDLERFRRINETLGRQAGDELLDEVGGRLHKQHDSTARLGADMFGLVLRGARSAAEVNRALEAVIGAAFADPARIRGADLRVACRAGVALYPADGADADTLLRNAETALRRSKGSAERLVFYAAEMNAQVADALSMENKLRRAVERREFVLHYQPKVLLKTGTIVSAEALIRWNDPEKGLVPPLRFIPVLEETGLIREVGRWALEQTFADLNAWTRQGLRAPRIAVNVSAIQLQDKAFVDTVIKEIERGGDTPDLLELEITESLVMRNVEDSTRKLSILRGMGVTVAIDDFGTGYSSLSYLSRLPVDYLKIDRSFIQGVIGRGDAETLVKAIIALAHGLKLKVVAEGVETEEQAAKLRQLGCDQAQGYLYSKPVTAGELAKLLAPRG